MIPKIIHFIYGLDDDYGKLPFVFCHWAAVKSARKLNPDYEIYYWYKNLPDSKYIDDLRGDVKFKKLDSVPTHIFGNELCCVAHKADVVRLEVLKEYGGIYLDIDTITVKPFDDLLNNKVLMGREQIPGIVDGLCNAVILSEPNSQFIDKWYDSYKTFRSKGQDPSIPNDYYVEHSVWMPLWIANDHPDLITIVPMHYFFSPDWREHSLKAFLCDVVDSPEAYVHHLWESKSYPYLKNVDEFSYSYTTSTYSNIINNFLKDEVKQLQKLTNMRYTFVDIGCSYFDTSVEAFGMDVNGLLVEPLKSSYDLLPTSDTVIKAPFAISDREGKCVMNTPKMSPNITEYMTKKEVADLRLTNPELYDSILNIGSTTLSDSHYYLDMKTVEMEQVECDMITFYQLCDMYDIQEVDYLNIDTEGHDHVILKQVLDMVDKGTLKINYALTFEYNEMSNKPELDVFCELFESRGFRSEHVADNLWNDDIVLTRIGIDNQKDQAFYARKERSTQIKALYRTVLNREYDIDGFNHYLYGGLSIAQIKDVFMTSDEYAKLRG